MARKICLPVGVLVFMAATAAAQVTVDQAHDLFNSGKMEEACQAFSQLDKTKPGDPQIHPYVNMSCGQVQRLQKTEEDLFNQGVQLFNQGQLDDARQKFQQATNLKGLKTFKYRDRSQQYLKQIDARQGEEQAFQDGVKLYNDGKYDDAKNRFTPIAQGGGAHAAEAGTYLAKIKDAIDKQHAADQVRQTFDEGVRMYKAGRFADADVDFQKVVKAGGPQAAEAQDYLAKIEQSQKETKEAAKTKDTKTTTTATNTTPGNPPKTNEPANPTPTLNLRAGLKAYFDGDLDAAEGDLSQYLQQNGSKRDLAYFFRGAAHGTRYYLSGEKDSREKQLAVADFQAAKKADRDFQPPSKYIAPKIIKLYAQTASDAGQ